MANLPFPNVGAQRSSWKLLTTTGVFTSPLSGATQTISRPGARWSADFGFSNLSVASRATLMAFLAEMRGQENRFYMYDPANPLRGSFDDSNLITNSDFDSATTGWTASASTLSVNGGRLKITNSGAANGQARSGAITVISGVSYAIDFSFIAGNVEACQVLVGTTAGASNLYDSGNLTSGGRTVGAFTASGTTAHVTLICDTTTTADYVYYDNVRLSRCALVAGGSQTGSALNIDALTVSTNGLALRGDWVGVGDQLLMLSDDLDSDSGGAGRLKFTPALRASPADNDPVVFYRPQLKCILQDTSGWSNRPGVFSDMSLTAIEDVV